MTRVNINSWCFAQSMTHLCHLDTIIGKSITRCIPVPISALIHKAYDINVSGRIESRRRMVLVEQAPQFRLMLYTTYSVAFTTSLFSNHPDLWSAFLSLGIWPRAEDSRFLERNFKPSEDDGM